MVLLARYSAGLRGKSAAYVPDLEHGLRLDQTMNFPPIYEVKYAVPHTFRRV